MARLKAQWVRTGYLHLFSQGGQAAFGGWGSSLAEPNPPFVGRIHGEFHVSYHDLSMYRYASWVMFHVFLKMFCSNISVLGLSG